MLLINSAMHLNHDGPAWVLSVTLSLFCERWLHCHLSQSSLWVPPPASISTEGAIVLQWAIIPLPTGVWHEIHWGTLEDPGRWPEHGQHPPSMGTGPCRGNFLGNLGFYLSEQRCPFIVTTMSTSLKTPRIVIHHSYNRMYSTSLNSKQIDKYVNYAKMWHGQEEFVLHLLILTIRPYFLIFYLKGAVDWILSAPNPQAEVLNAHVTLLGDRALGEVMRVI